MGMATEPGMCSPEANWFRYSITKGSESKIDREHPSCYNNGQHSQPVMLLGGSHNGPFRAQSSGPNQQRSAAGSPYEAAQPGGVRGAGRDCGAGKAAEEIY